MSVATQKPMSMPPVPNREDLLATYVALLSLMASGCGQDVDF